MNLTEEEKKICNHYSQRFEDGKVGCSRCPLVINTRWYICKANCTEEEWTDKTGTMIDEAIKRRAKVESIIARTLEEEEWQ